MTVKLPTEQQLELLSLKEGITGLSESTLVKMPHCWKSRLGSIVFMPLSKAVSGVLGDSRNARNSCRNFWKNGTSGRTLG